MADVMDDALALRWQAYEASIEPLATRFDGLFRAGLFEYAQPLRLQAGVPMRLRKPYAVRVAYTDWGPADAPIVVCCGGVANTAMRFCFLAAELMRERRVVCMDWVGRGRSGWLADEREYTLATCVEQLQQLIAHLGGRRVSLLGSSMGGSVAIAMAARSPSLIERLVLNDIGPAMPQARRRRRADTLARHYVFRDPDALARRVGAAQKNDGPVGDDIRRFITHHQTRWSNEDGGRIYRHDPRAMQAYRREAATPLDQWQAWQQVRCPVLLLHGLQSDALLPPTIARMRGVRTGLPFSVAHIPDTGHTPVLSDRQQTGYLRDWLQSDGRESTEVSLPHARPREDWRWGRERSQKRSQERDQAAANASSARKCASA